MKRFFSLICMVTLIVSMLSCQSITWATEEAEGSPEYESVPGSEAVSSIADIDDDPAIESEESGGGLTAEDGNLDGDSTSEAKEGDTAAEDGITAVEEPAEEEAYTLTEEDWELIGEAQEALGAIVSSHDVFALVYLVDEYAVRSGPSGDSDIEVWVPSGQTVQILNITLEDIGTAWAQVSFYYHDLKYIGYVERANLALSDELFLEWESEYPFMNPASISVMTTSTAAAARSVSSDIAQFPASYQAQLTALKQAHPNWIFVPQKISMDWNSVVDKEAEVGSTKKQYYNLIQMTQPSYTWSEAYDSTWASATRETVAYYMDPRNSLTETLIFQFEQLTYNASYHTEAATQNILNGTFMSGKISGTSQTYANAFYQIGSTLGVSPFHLASRAVQEQGVKGTSPLISGTYPGYEGYYNYYNIKASGSTSAAIYVNGLTYAKSQGWDTPYKSLYGGAQFISANYILKGQDTAYLQKFSVNNDLSYVCSHQYMQNVMAPTSEAKTIYNGYKTAGALDNPFVFKIPVYENMPSTACSYPSATVSYEISVTLPSGYSDATLYLDGVPYDAAKSGSTLKVTAPNGNVKTVAVYKYNSSGTPTGMYVWTASFSSTYTLTEQPDLENLLIYNGFSIRITGKSGIRCKTSISKSLRDWLTSSGGVNGYTLMEYGTLITPTQNLTGTALVLGYGKAQTATAFSAENKIDNIYETVDGRYRYTAVLTGIPSSNYKTELTFRGYITLTKNGVEYTFYGPPVSRSIYALAEQILASNTYESGSAADRFLKGIISDAQ